MTLLTTVGLVCLGFLSGVVLAVSCPPRPHSDAEDFPGGL